MFDLSFSRPFSRRSSDASTSSSTSSSSSPSFLSTSTFDLLEPPSPSELPHLFVVERSLASPARKQHVQAMPAPSASVSSSLHASHRREKRPPCTLSDPDFALFPSSSSPSFLSFPRHHTSVHSTVCPRHGIVHDPYLALPARDSREACSTGSVCSFSSARSSRSSSSGASWTTARSSGSLKEGWRKAVGSLRRGA
ncbi:hypothetical protein JCM10207_001287 [Rhodosporidiobolus poonsookiae]